MTPGPAGDWGKGFLEVGREDILEWREERLLSQARHKSVIGFKAHSFNLSTLRTFIRNFNCMVVFNIVIGGVAVYLAQRFNIYFDIQLSLLVSPIVFPLAFSINTDFQRRDIVLEYIAHFESSAMILFMCMREWRKDTGFDDDWIKRVHGKLKSVLFLLREYLFTGEDENRTRILRATYEDFSDISLIIEELRTSKLQPNGPLLSRVIHLLNVMCLSFERLRVVKEYRSPRSIRAFNKVLITFLPLFMAPYFVYLGRRSENMWSPYLISVVISFVFSALQGVQDKLDDPFDGMGEDDIKLNAIEDWTLNSFEATVQRVNTVRFDFNADGSGYSELKGNCQVNSAKDGCDEMKDVHSSTQTVTSTIDESKRENPASEQCNPRGYKHKKIGTYRDDGNSSRYLYTDYEGEHYNSYSNQPYVSFSDQLKADQKSKIGHHVNHQIKSGENSCKDDKRSSYSQLLEINASKNEYSNLFSNPSPLPSENILKNKKQKKQKKNGNRLRKIYSIANDTNSKKNSHELENLSDQLTSKHESFEIEDSTSGYQRTKIEKILEHNPDYPLNDSEHLFVDKHVHLFINKNDVVQPNLEDAKMPNEKAANEGSGVLQENLNAAKPSLFHPKALPKLRRDENGLTTVLSNEPSPLSIENQGQSIPVTGKERDNIVAVSVPETLDNNSLEKSQRRVSSYINISYENDVDVATSTAFLTDKYKIFSIENLISPSQRICIADYNKSQKKILH